MVVYFPGLRRHVVYVWTHELAHLDTGARVPLQAFHSKHRLRWAANRSARRWLARYNSLELPELVVNAPGGNYGPAEGGEA